MLTVVEQGVGRSSVVCYYVNVCKSSHTLQTKRPKIYRPNLATPTSPFLVKVTGQGHRGQKCRRE